MNLLTEHVSNPRVRSRVERLRGLRVPRLEIKTLATQRRDEVAVGVNGGTIYQPVGGEPLNTKELCDSLDWILGTIEERGLHLLFFAGQVAA